MFDFELWGRTGGVGIESEHEDAAGDATSPFVDPSEVDSINLAVVRIQRAMSELLSACDDLDRRIEGSATEAGADEMAAVHFGVLDFAMVDLWEVRSLLDAALVGVMSPWDLYERWHSDGSRSASARLVREVRCSPNVAKETIWRARALRWMPRTRAAFMNAELTTSFVDLLIRTRPRVGQFIFRSNEEMLVGWARTQSYEDLVRSLEYWIAEMNRARDEEHHEELTKKRRLSVMTDDQGVVSIKGVLDPTNGAIVAAELRRLEHELYLKDQASGSTRTKGQRQADALMQMAMRSKAVPPGARRPRVLISVVTGHEDFIRLCELSNGVRVAPGQLVPLLGIADIEHIAFDGQKRAITATRQRSFTGALRRAIEIRDRHCQHPCGCRIAAANCDIDHIRPYAKGGRTSQENGRALCSTHNRNPVLRARSPEPHPAVTRARRRLQKVAVDDDDHAR